MQQAASMEKRAGPRHLYGNVDEVARHRVMLAVGKVGLEVQLARRAGVREHRTVAAVQARGAQRRYVAVHEAGELGALDDEERGLVRRRCFWNEKCVVVARYIGGVVGCW